MVLRDDASRFNRKSAKKNETTKGLRLGSVEMGLESGNDQGLAVYNKHILQVKA